MTSHVRLRKSTFLKGGAAAEVGNKRLWEYRLQVKRSEVKGRERKEKDCYWLTVLTAAKTREDKTLKKKRSILHPRVNWGSVVTVCKCHVEDESSLCP